MWWRDGLLYQVYPRSFADSDGDGIGDLRGIIARLDHLEWLGVDGLWLNPTFPSPNADWGFDVSDYRGVHPELGTLEDLDELVARAGERGIRVLLDLVPNHTSDQHPWFRERRDFYVWREGRNGGPPNNWKSTFGGAGVDARRGQRRSGTCTTSRPSSPTSTGGTRTCAPSSTTSCASGWTAGSRASGSTSPTGSSRTASCATTRRPPTTTSTTTAGSASGWSTRPTARRSTTSSAAGATWSTRTRRCSWARPGCSTCEKLMRFYGEDLDELHLAFNFVFLHADFEAAQLAPIVAETEALLPEHAWPVWTLGNHDMARFPTRWAHGDPGLARCALMLLLTLRGTPVLYYGDELAMPEAEIAPERIVDPVGLRNDPEFPGRDGARTPMPWTDEPGAGFTTPGAEPWLPFGEVAGVNVAAQRADPGSPLNLTRDLIALRRAEEDLRAGAYAEVAVDEGLWAYRRGDGMLVALNLGAERREHPGRGHDRDRHPPPARRRGDRAGRCCWRPARASCA